MLLFFVANGQHFQQNYSPSLEDPLSIGCLGLSCPPKLSQQTGPLGYQYLQLTVLKPIVLDWVGEARMYSPENYKVQREEVKVKWEAEMTSAAMDATYTAINVLSVRRARQT